MCMQVQPGLLEGPESAQRLLLQCPSYLMPSINAQLLPILQRIQNSRDGKCVHVAGGTGRGRRAQ